jgi:YgiT-type zinc finger domain-containing protein
VKHYQSTKSEISCSHCHIGHMRRTTVTYFTFAGGRMITVPDFPAWECDICKRCEFDLDALDQLSLLLNPPVRTQKPSARRRKTAGDSPSLNPPSIK